VYLNKKKVALKLIPERENFVSLLLGPSQDFEDLKEDIRNMISMLQPLIDEMNSLSVRTVNIFISL
jgi:hypothetical protein